RTVPTYRQPVSGSSSSDSVRYPPASFQSAYFDAVANAFVPLLAGVQGGEYSAFAVTRKNCSRFVSFGFALAFLLSVDLRAETGYDAWLRYTRLDDVAAARYGAVIPAVV